jgi:hypothetical protein
LNPEIGANGSEILGLPEGLHCHALMTMPNLLGNGANLTMMPFFASQSRATS